METRRSEKSATTALLLCLFLGGLGIHRFYVGKVGTGIAMLLTGGGLGIWTIIDLVVIACGNFTDKDGNVLEFDKPSSSTAKKVLFVLGVVFAAFLLYITLLVSFVFYATSGVVDAVREELSAIRSGDYKKAYSYTSADFQNSTSMAEFTSYIKRFPALKDNVDSTFNSRSIENDRGTVKGTVKGKNGESTDIQFVLIKENGVWKILNIKINPEGAGIESGSDKSDNSSSGNSKAEDSDNESSSNVSGTNQLDLSKVYESENNRYVIHYPSDWEYTTPDKATVVFGGKAGTPQYDSTVNIQTVLTKSDGGKYENVTEFMQGLKDQAMSMADDTKILSEEDISLDKTADSIAMNGKYIVFTYTYHGVKYKQLQFVFERDDKRAFYAWAYTSTLDRYQKDYPIAKAMFGTWAVQ